MPVSKGELHKVISTAAIYSPVSRLTSTGRFWAGVGRVNICTLVWGIFDQKQNDKF